MLSKIKYETKWNGKWKNEPKPEAGFAKHQSGQWFTRIKQLKSKGC